MKCIILSVIISLFFIFALIVLFSIVIGAKFNRVCDEIERIEYQKRNDIKGKIT